MSPRVRAPELRGRGWLNTGGALTLADLRGRITSWTSGPSAASTACTCSMSCGRWRRSTPTCSSSIGVHSPKFEHEKRPGRARRRRRAVRRDHPVLDDPELDMWQQYAAKAWPTLSVIDPEGYVVATMAGEGHAEGLARLIDELVARARGEGHAAPRRRPVRAAGRAPDTVLRFPGKALALRRRALPGLATRRSTRWSSSTPTARRCVRRIGTGAARPRGRHRTAASSPSRSGLCLLPAARRRDRRVRRGRRRHGQPPAARASSWPPAR